MLRACSPPRVPGRGEIAQPEPLHRLEVPAVAGDDGQVVLEGGRGDERIGDGDACLAANPAGSLGHMAVDDQLAKGVQESLDEG